MPNSQPLQKPSLLSRIGARVDDPPRHVGPSKRNPHSYYSKQKEETRLRPMGNNSDGKQASGLTTGHAGRHPQAKQHVPDSSFVDSVPAIRQPTDFSPGAVIQEWNNHTYGILATMSISGSPAGSDIKSMSVDDGPLDSRRFRKRSSRMSVDPSPLTGTYRKASSQMSVDPSSPNAIQSAQRKTSSYMSVDVPSTRRSQGSSDRMLIDEIQQHYGPTQNLPQQVYSHCGPSFAARPTVSPTMTYSRNTSAHFPRDCTLASSALPPTSFSLQHMSQSHDRGFPRREADSASIPSSRLSSLQHGCGKENQVLSQKTSPSRPCTSQQPSSLISSSLAHSPGRSKFSAAVPPGMFSPKHGTPASRQGNGSPPTSPDAIHCLSPTSRSRIHARGSSSEYDASYKRHCVRQDSQPSALLSIDCRSACGTSLQSQSLSPINEAWLPPMEKQLEMARKSQLKARFREIKAIIGVAVNEIRETIVPYHKDYRKRKVARTNTNSEPFSGVPDYLRTIERYNPPKPQTHPDLNHARHLTLGRILIILLKRGRSSRCAILQRHCEGMIGSFKTKYLIFLYHPQESTRLLDAKAGYHLFVELHVLAESHGSRVVMKSKYT
ncbi:hypothetical protein BD769DRAFT_1661845 [Suillus cothurnatus]|nr:hypothetical protein BD769DRAFT_1661845 [Suillus cothurnatus]